MINQSRPIVEVAVGILLKDQSFVLMGKRPSGKPYAGYWEFPGGKLEVNESITTALERELYEELGIRIDLDKNHCQEIMMLEHDYPHAYVRLHVCLVDRWEGEPVSLENQELSWQNIFNSELTIKPLLPAAWPMIEKVRWYLRST
ncbi:NUDIX domain-containing protein [Polynucleobacter sp. HIN9]|uniref:NUDIX domain-containing protein n=1 Tax=Polynucleobacter sp. HIN9 TaxID=3047868 RepID=UPI002573BF86|nr:NUDIX domain-containing protein [Polynucleobacter sp. HIN9]BEI40238.1 NUDIX domain-containing protein [Polynucleobacter sp. HIN9]